MYIKRKQYQFFYNYIKKLMDENENRELKKGKFLLDKPYLMRYHNKAACKAGPSRAEPARYPGA